MAPTVRQVIEYLRKQPQDALVFLDTEEAHSHLIGAPFLTLEEALEQVKEGPEGECGRCGSLPGRRDLTCPECSPEGEVDDDERNCAHEWNQSAGEADESGTRIYCLKCGQDGDA